MISPRSPVIPLGGVMDLFILDASSYQGSIDWPVAGKTVQCGFEKVTEGTGYVNPYWPAAKTSLISRSAAGGFVKGCYLFLDASGSGTVQADWFAQHAGDLTGFALAVDFERAPDGPPTLTQAQQAVTRLRQLYPHHPVGLYAPHWFTGGENLGFGDWLWASSYVTGTGTPDGLYQSVPGSYWAGYGGRPPDVLQFTSTASIPGVAGACDCSAFRGTLAQFETRVLPATATPPAHVTHQETSMADSIPVQLLPGDPVTLPVWAGAAKGEPTAFAYASLQLTAAAVSSVAVTFSGAGHTETQTITVPAGVAVAVAPVKPLAWGQVSTVTLTRGTPAAGGVLGAPEPSVMAVLTRW